MTHQQPNKLATLLAALFVAPAIIALAWGVYWLLTEQAPGPECVECADGGVE